MTSWQLKLSHWLVRPMRFAQGILARNMSEKSLIRFCKCSESQVTASSKAQDVSKVIIDIDGVKAYWFEDVTSSSDEAIYFVHGGGFCFGWNANFEKIATRIVQLTGISVLAVDYRLAPEHCYPAAHNDTRTAYRWLLDDDYEPEQITMIGDSSGATLVLSLLIQMRDKKQALPNGAIFLSPSVDLTFKDNWFWSKKDSFVHPRYISTINSFYIKDQATDDAHISPIFGDFSKLPPILIITGEKDIMFHDAKRLAQKAKSATIETQLHLIDDAWHGWYLFHGLIPEAETTFVKIANWLNSD